MGIQINYIVDSNDVEDTTHEGEAGNDAEDEVEDHSAGSRDKFLEEWNKEEHLFPKLGGGSAEGEVSQVDDNRNEYSDYVEHREQNDYSNDQNQRRHFREDYDEGEER